MSNPETKTCKKCGLEKPVVGFFKSKTNKDGLHGECIECINSARRIYMQSGEAKKKAVEATARYYARNIEKVKEKNRECKAKRRKDRPNEEKEYRKNNIEKYRLAVRKCSQKHRSAISDYYLTKTLGVPEDCIELKRAQIQILRATKQLVETIKEKQK